jgi:hypothetical protein
LLSAKEVLQVGVVSVNRPILMGKPLIPAAEMALEAIGAAMAQ